MNVVVSKVVVDAEMEVKFGVVEVDMLEVVTIRLVL